MGQLNGKTLRADARQLLFFTGFPASAFFRVSDLPPLVGSVGGEFCGVF